jgi:hypothetical protein
MDDERIERAMAEMTEVMARFQRKQIAMAWDFLEANGYTVIPPGPDDDIS